jgi:hypothetical protein
MAGTLRNVQPGVPVPIQTRNGPRCIQKVANPSGRTRFKGQFVCNSRCGLPTKKPSKRCGYGGGQMMQQFPMQGGYGRRQLGGY